MRSRRKVKDGAMGQVPVIRRLWNPFTVYYARTHDGCDRRNEKFRLQASLPCLGAVAFWSQRFLVRAGHVGGGALPGASARRRRYSEDVYHRVSAERPREPFIREDGHSVTCVPEAENIRLPLGSRSS